MLPIRTWIVTAALALVILFPATAADRYADDQAAPAEGRHSILEG